MDDAMTDPVCCDCGGPLMIIERDAAILRGACADCGNSHEFEVSTDPDGAKTYWPFIRISLKPEVST